MLLDWVGATAGPAASLISGIMGKSSQDKSRALHEKAQQDARHQFQQQMDHSIRRRVEDAKRAGVHPLFALGASVGASPTISTSSRAPEGNPMGEAIARLGEQLGMIAQNRASARRDEAEAALLDSQRKRLELDLVSQGHDKISEIDVVPQMRGTVVGPASYVSPEVAKSQRTGVESGTHPARREFVDEMGNIYTGFSPAAQMDEIGQLEYLLGLPDRIFQTIRKDYANQRYILDAERDLKTLKRMKAKGVTEREARAFMSDVARKLEKLRKRFAGYYRTYRSWYE